MKLLSFVAIAGALSFGFHSPISLAQTRIWGTYYGGAQIDDSRRIAVDAVGNSYVIGYTRSATGITTPNGFDPFFDAGPYDTRAYLAKWSTDGKLLWATYYGDNESYGYDLGMDALGNIYITGTVYCPSVSLSTPGTNDVSCSGGQDIFLAKFDPTGKRIWGTYYGGMKDETNPALHVTPAGNVYLTGKTVSDDGIASAQSPDSSRNGESDVFIAHFYPSGQLNWARYFGGESYDTGVDISCGEPNTVGPKCFIVGYTQSKNGIATAGAHDIVLGGNLDAFVAQFDAANGNITWATYYGGSKNDGAYAVTVDRDLNVYVGGFTQSPDGMATVNAHDGTLDNDDGFLARFTSEGLRQAATYFGTEGSDWIADLATDSNKNLYVVGKASKAGGKTPTDGVVTATAYDKVFNGNSDAFIAKFNQILVLMRSTYYGGNDEEGYYGTFSIAVGQDQHMHVIGKTMSNDAIATPGAHKTANQDTDTFIVEFSQ